LLWMAIASALFAIMNVCGRLSARVGAAGFLSLVFSYAGGVFILDEPTAPLGITGAGCVIASGLGLGFVAVRESSRSLLGKLPAKGVR